MATTKSGALNWMNITKKYLGRSSHKYWKHLSYDIWIVDKGIRMSFLFDYSSVSSETLSDFLGHLQKCNFVENRLLILQVEQDLFVGNRNVLVQGLKSILDDRLVTFIDVSNGLALPEIINQQRHDVLFNTISEVLNQIQEDSGNVVTIKTKNCDNIITIFGILLGYPTVYWCSNDDAENCLSMVPLCCVKVHGSFMTDQGNSMSGNDEIHNIYQFSYPDGLKEELQEKINIWFEDVKKKCSGLLTDVKLETSVTVLPAVAL